MTMINSDLKGLTLKALRSSSAESDVCRRQILTCKVDPRTVTVILFLMAVDPYHKLAAARLTSTYYYGSVKHIDPAALNPYTAVQSQKAVSAYL